jgi:uncharacterized protein YlxW (UPF0749 family)
MSSMPDPETPRPGRSWRGLGGLRAQLLVALLLAALGFAAVTQVKLTRSDDDFSGQRREDLVDLLDSLSAAADRTRNQLDDLEQARDDLLSSSERRQAAIEEGNQRLEVLRILTGTVAADGPGITITVMDPEDAVTAATLRNGVEELRDAGAEAIEINDVVRIVGSTAFTETDGVISADGVELRPPYVIDAIGSSHTLGDAVVFPGGLSDEVAQLGGSVDVHEKDLVEVGSLHTLDSPEYSQPTSG